MRILVIEDEEKVASFIARGLREVGCVVRLCETGDDGLHVALTTPFDVILVDINLPGMSGLEVARGLRRRGVDTPILAVTAAGGIDDRVSGLDAGCDDYLAKPFAFEELLARIRALHRRSRGAPAVRLAYHGLTLDSARRIVKRGDRVLALSNREFALLNVLLREPERVFTKTSLIEQVWGSESDVSSNVLEVYVKCLRRKIDDGFSPKLIQTVRGVGYALRAA